MWQPFNRAAPTLLLLVARKLENSRHKYQVEPMSSFINLSDSLQRRTMTPKFQIHLQK